MFYFDCGWACAIRVRVDRVGASAQMGPLKVLTSSLQGNLSVLASSSLSIVITRFCFVFVFLILSFFFPLF